MADITALSSRPSNKVTDCSIIIVYPCVFGDIVLYYDHGYRIFHGRCSGQSLLLLFL